MATLPGTAEITAKLHTQLAIPVRDFGSLLGMKPVEVSMAVSQGRMGIRTFQIIERGRHMVACKDVIEFFAQRGIDLAPADQALAS